VARGDDQKILLRDAPLTPNGCIVERPEAGGRTIDTSDTPRSDPFPFGQSICWGEVLTRRDRRAWVACQRGRMTS
jgi:hypothetical protein